MFKASKSAMLSTTPTIREAHVDDCPRILELIHQLARYENAQQEVTISLEELQRTGFGTQPVWKAFVAQSQGTLVAFALYYTRFSTWKGCRLYLEDLYVTEEARSSGVGTLLFDRIVREAIDKKYKGIAWQVLDWNTPAINFYKKYTNRFDSDWINVSIEADELIFLRDKND